MSEKCKNCIKRISGDDPGCLTCVDGSGKKELDAVELSVVIRELLGDLEVAIKKKFPIGCYVNYFHGSMTIPAQVIGYDSDAQQLKVRGLTGKEYWVHHFRCFTDAEQAQIWRV